jgi:uncharacterized protein (TIGR03083 family)
MVDTGLLLEEADVQGKALVAAADRHVGASLPSCPLWNMHDLLAHVGTFASQFLGRMDGAPTNGPWSKDVPPEYERLSWFAALHAELLAMFRRNDDGEWGDNRPAPHLRVGHLRRWTHELSIHRWDAEKAGGDPSPIPAALAADGVEEMIERFMAPPFWRSPRSDQRLRLSGADVSWLLRFDQDAAAWSYDAAQAGAEVAGSVSDLNLFLWGRVGIDQLRVTGDRSVVALLRGAARA